ncbi:hypothetical protein GE21DRAFT_9544 [Neurospora crassa]|uniref:C2H2-type domain-containing protein n=1 Tax=Neurospora crassa (strain ATCC 24698 / 74-OR23-1A / CBS 708.71 / DSM 1257 / FGSC 987) TaxID=367110 RepID=Q7RXC3_NEUCR|nr:hypothetical protein NCU05061 [Neurospora crassa OR74A]EAA27199.1 hypothetical protein NCU05061 [Neurospora crassa OR74A]KHE83845.1 hypothetical protein GE21DRAFT_9544 [Neurospora crassa]|eukprot:XP_956435.1 hypothetical protein NCU05061 [Neurospora crassa OR74A]
MSYPDPAPPGVVDNCIDPRLLTLPMDVENGGSARSPSTVNSPSTPSDFSSYVGSGAESPSDVGFSLAEMEQELLSVAQDPTGLNAAPGDTMHDITAAQHGVLQETPGPWTMTMPANELAALKDGYVNIYNQAQPNVDQVGESLQQHHNQLEGEGYMYGGEELYTFGDEQHNAPNPSFIQQQGQSFVQYPPVTPEEPLIQGCCNPQLTNATLATTISPETPIAFPAPMNGVWLSGARFPLSPTYLQSHSPIPSHIHLYHSHPSHIPAPFLSPTSSAPSPSPSTSSSSSSSSSNRRSPEKKKCQAAEKCNYFAHSKELKKHYRTTHKKYAEEIGILQDPFECTKCKTSFVRKDFLARHQRVQRGKTMSACERAMKNKNKKEKERVHT